MWKFDISKNSWSWETTMKIFSNGRNIPSSEFGLCSVTMNTISRFLIVFTMPLKVCSAAPFPSSNYINNFKNVWINTASQFLQENGIRINNTSPFAVKSSMLCTYSFRTPFLSSLWVAAATSVAFILPWLFTFNVWRKKQPIQPADSKSYFFNARTSPHKLMGWGIFSWHNVYCQSSWRVWLFSNTSWNGFIFIWIKTD